MKYLVDANVLGEATTHRPSEMVIQWLRRNEHEIALDPIILGEIRFGILLLPAGKRRRRLETWIDEGIARLSLLHGLTVATRNQNDFMKAGVAIVNPFDGT